MSLLKEKIEIAAQEAELKAEDTLRAFPPFVKWFIIISLLAVIPLYFLTKAISQKTWQTKYLKQRVVAKPSFENPKPLVIAETSVTTMGEKVYAAAAEVTNENLDLSAQNIHYRFKFYNSKKEQIYIGPQETFFILPNQKKYLSLPRFETTEPVAYTELEIDTDIHWQKRLQIPQITFTVSTPTSYLQPSPPAYVVEGSFTNQSPYLLKTVRLTFVLKNSGGKIIGISRRDEFTVQAFEKRSYKQLWPNVAAPNGTKVEVSAETNPFDSSNLTAASLPSGSASDLSRPKTSPY